MTTKEDYLKLNSLINQTESKLKKKEEQLKEIIQSFDYYRGYRNGINIVQNLENSGRVSDKKPDTLIKLNNQVEVKYKMYVENCIVIHEYPSIADMNGEFTRGQIMGMNDTSKILFKHDCLKKIGINVELLKNKYERIRQI